MTPRAAGLDPRDLRDIEANYLDERSSRWMYLALAALELSEERASLLRQLAEYEEKHADQWSGLLRSLGWSPPREDRLLEHRLLLAAARAFGVAVALPLLHRGEVDGIAKYKLQAERWRDTPAHATVQAILPDEVEHEVDLFQAMRSAGGRSGVRTQVSGTF